MLRRIKIPFSEINRLFCSTVKLPLQGIKVLDLTRVLAGPFCTMNLADHGAEVIKIEKPGTGDETRTWGPPWIGDQSCYFLSINRNKKSMAVDIKSPIGKSIIKKLASESDVLIENYIPGKLTGLGLGYEDLKAGNEKLIYCSLTGYGQSGPYAQNAGYDVVAAGTGGLLHITGTESGEPCRVGVAITDITTGLYAFSSILAAIIESKNSGKGQYIDCNLLASQVAVLTHIASNFLNAGVEARRYGTAHPSIVPYQAFQTVDGHIILGVGNNRHFRILCDTIGSPELADDEKFSENGLRVEHRNELISLLSKRISQKTTQFWLDAFHGKGIPFGPINSIQEVFDHPQVTHLNLVQTLEHSKVGKIKVPGPPVNYSRFQYSDSTPPPLLGQHTKEILMERLHFSEEKIKNLEYQEIIQCY